MSVKEAGEQLGARDEVTLETEQREPDVTIPSSAHRLSPRSPETAPIAPEAEPKPFSLDHHTPIGRVPSVSRVKPPRPMDAASGERPHSAFFESELKNKRDGDSEIQVMSFDKRSSIKKAKMTEDSADQLGSVMPFGPSSVQQQAQGEIESTRGIRRPTPGSGSFHFSINPAKTQDGERPRSGSFIGMLGQAEARHKATEDKPSPSSREKEELRDFQPRGNPFAVGRPKQEGGPPKSSVLPWERRESLKKTEPVTESKNTTTDAGAAAAEQVESSQEDVEVAVEAQELQEEEGKTAFGVKLRSTSQSIRFRSDAASNHLAKPLACEDQTDKQQRQEASDNVGHISKKLPTNFSHTSSTSGDTRVTGEHLRNLIMSQ